VASWVCSAVLVALLLGLPLLLSLLWPTFRSVPLGRCFGLTPEFWIPSKMQEWIESSNGVESG
jgi:hypothetical protein